MAATIAIVGKHQAKARLPPRHALVLHISPSSLTSRGIKCRSTQQLTELDRSSGMYVASSAQNAEIEGIVGSRDR
jgi:hypothetical protein